jgi:outer membrane murein-binding lipoprotein Lpp
MNDRELLEFIATQVGTLTGRVDTLTGRVDTLTGRVETLTGRVETLTKDMTEIRTRLTSVENIVTRIEHNHGQKLQALFDGYKQHTDQLERIEKEVSGRDEFILKKIK